MSNENKEATELGIRRSHHITAKVVADSIYNGSRVVSVETTSPKFLDAEIEKHRMLNTNSSSSRAIPVKRLADQVINDPYIPMDVRSKQKGMQGYDRVPDHVDVGFCSQLYDIAAMLGEQANIWDQLDDIHKQHINRYIEPFTVQCKVISGNYEAFEAMLRLREAPNADPNIQAWAYEIRKAIVNSKPTELKVGEWHLPYVDEEYKQSFSSWICRSISVAKCASISYHRQEARKPVADYIGKAIMLATEGHWSCFDHQVMPATAVTDKGITAISTKGKLLSGAYSNWICYRNLLQD